ncbi:MAG: toll/interleukin-1 receptor domain-containing protein [Methanoregula sp.]|nr:toll/interleukin-1 receptor domain-containing protein [Methanoregula sp.]
MHHFISYSTADAQDFAFRLADSLVASHPTISIWIDRQNIHVGKWDEQIDQAISSCESLIFIMTRDSVESPVCKNEWRQALTYKKPIIPLLLHADAKLPFRLNSWNYVDFTQQFDVGLAELRKHLQCRQIGKNQGWN